MNFNLVDHIAIRLYGVVCGFVLAVQSLIAPRQAVVTSRIISQDLDRFLKIIDGVENVEN
jgi:hypothetical protein